MQSLFISATGTNVGKTHTTLKLIEALSDKGLSVGVFKPIETGVTDTAPDASLLLKACQKVNENFKNLEIVKEVLWEGPTRTSILTKDGVQVDLRIIEKKSWGAALQYFTGSKAHNIALVFDSHGKEVAKYSKLHPFNYANEGKYFASGNETIKFELDGVACSVFICYDLRFPEIFRQIAEEVEVIFVIANWPHTREMHWQNLLIARAIENQCFIVGVNRIGNDGVGLKYNGSSMVINPSGEVLLQTDKITEYDTCDIDISMVSKARKSFPFLEDIRFI